MEVLPSFLYYYLVWHITRSIVLSRTSDCVPSPGECYLWYYARRYDKLMMHYSRIVYCMCAWHCKSNGPSRANRHLRHLIIQQPRTKTTTTNPGITEPLYLYGQLDSVAMEPPLHYYTRDNALGSTDTLMWYSRRQEGQTPGAGAH